MEFDQNLLLNFASIIITILLLLVTSITVFQRLKSRWPSSVNCWFCNKNTNVWRQQLNWWLCSHCEQYNGFTKSGDYAQSIPEQYKSSPNSKKKYCTSSKTVSQSPGSPGGLCQRCNHYERIKLSKLSEFLPISERNFDYEIEQFKISLEERYPLCAKCRSTVHNVLCKQSIWLAQYKMLLFKHNPIRTIINNAKYSETIFRIISTILDSMVAYNTELLLLPVTGLFFQLCACWATPTKKKSSDIVPAFLWICIVLLVPFKDLKLLKTDIDTAWFSIDYVTQHHMIVFFAFIIGILNIKPKSLNSVSVHNMSFKKIDTSPRVREFDEQPILYSQRSNTKSSIQLESPIVTKHTVSPVSLARTEIRVRSPSVAELSVCKNNVSNNYSVGNLSTFSTLSLSGDQPKYTSRTPKIFEKRIYGSTSPNLFKKSSAAINRKPILSPPKLKSVTQSSWVAGGYWQEGMDAPSLSRSSSQSSGFGSACSNFAPSREPSIHEFDQCSVISDITQPCYPSRPNSANSVGSLSYQVSPYSFTESRTPVYNQTMRFSPNQTLMASPVLLQSHQNSNSKIYLDPCAQSQKMNMSDMKTTDMRMFPGHTTIVTSPVWLPALLCGSLVLNIIVLCTTLLR